jgi:hypothetical protein
MKQQKYIKRDMNKNGIVHVSVATGDLVVNVTIARKTQDGKSGINLSNPISPLVGDDKDTPKTSRTYRLTDELIKALRRKAYRDKSLDMSRYVRAALRIYLKDDIEALRNGEKLL